MQGTGNDFIIIDNRINLLSKEEIIALAPKMCDRRFGIGADGIIALHQAQDSAVDYTMFYRNADGSDAGMCGNGARCLALYACELGLGEQLVFNVHDYVYEANINPSENNVCISFPMDVVVEEVELEDNETVLQVQAGTEHIVKQVDEETLSKKEILVKQGRNLRTHTRFNPPGTNVNFITGKSKNALVLQTYERGVENLTLACGTGAIASALAWHHLQKISQPGKHTMQVDTEGGILDVHYSFDADTKSYTKIQLSGEAQFVFNGTYKY